MNEKLMLDQGLPRSAVDYLRRAGIDAVHSGEIGMATASDAAILQRARDEKRIVVTLDADFHHLMALASATSPSVIRIRIEGLRGEALAWLILETLKSCEDEVERGALVSIQSHGVRIRRLPLPRLSISD